MVYGLGGMAVFWWQSVRFFMRRDPEHPLFGSLWGPSSSTQLLNTWDLGGTGPLIAGYLYPEDSTYIHIYIYVYICVSIYIYKKPEQPKRNQYERFGKHLSARPVDSETSNSPKAAFQLLSASL